MKHPKLLISAAVVVAAVFAFVLCRREAPHEAASGTAGVSPSVAAVRTTSVAGATNAAASRILAPQLVAVAPAAQTQTPTARGTRPYVLTARVPFDKPLRLAAEALGAKTVSHASRRSVLIEADEATRARLEADARFEDVTEFAPAAKIQPELAALVEKGAKTVEVSILSLDAADRAAVVAALEREGGELLQGCINEGDTIRAKIPSDCVATLAARGEVRWLETFERPHLMNDRAVDAPLMNVRTVWDTHGLTGRGQRISTSDSGIDTGDLATLHRDLRNNVKDIQVVDGCYTNDVNGHGTHTAGSIVGDGTESTNNPTAYADGPIRGTAYEANLYAWSGEGKDGYFYTPNTMAKLYLNDGAWPASVHSASWGRNIAGQYTSQCVDHDRFVWKHPEFLPVFSAGNAGYNNGVVVRSIGAPGSAKNVLAVGATQNSRFGHDAGWGNGDPKKTAPFSSRGPCQDGRIKPDIAAPGVGILSTRSRGVDYSCGVKDEFYAYDSGTSMACPLTAGAVALVRQWLVEEKGYADEDGSRPTAALMKAVIMGGAKDAAVPNNNQGWGRVDLEETLFPSGGRAVKLVDRIPFASDWSTNIVIETTNAAPLDVQLVWVDYPGSASGSQAEPRLVNDLDLVVESRVDGLEPVLYGNGGAEPDTLNNAESVRIASAPATKYVITVDCKTILHDHTEGGAAALYIRGAFDPEATPEDPQYVRLVKRGQGFFSLDRALKAVCDDDETVEILDSVELRKSMTLTNSCTFVVTNANPLASPVTRKNGAALTLTENVSLTLSNFVFAAGAPQPAVTVPAGARLRLAGTVGLGTAATAAADGLDLAGAFVPALEGVMVDCPPAASIGAPFGTFSCDYPTASAAAGRIYNSRDEDLGGEAVAADGTLRWRVVTVPLEDARCILMTEDGVAGYRTFPTTLRAALALDKDACVAVRGAVAHTNTVTLAHDLLLTAAPVGDGTLSFGKDAGFVLPTGTTLVVSNLFVNGAGVLNGDCAFRLTGGALTLDDGAVLSGFRDAAKDEQDVGGLIVADPGRVTMKRGSRIEHCTMQKYGPIYLSGYRGEAVADLVGGSIYGCRAACGGAVYARAGAQVNVAGDFTAAVNYTGLDNDVRYSNVYLAGNSVLTLTGLLEGSLGVDGLPARMQEGVSFVRLGPDVTEAVARASADGFYNDADETLVGTYDEEAQAIVWAPWPDDDGQVYPLDANVIVEVDGESDPRYYATIDDAFTYVKGDARFGLRSPDILTRDAVIDHAITIGPWDEWSDATILRRNNAMYRVVAGGSLTISHAYVWGASWYHYGEWGVDSTVGLISVRGGSLTLDVGADVGLVCGSDSRAANAITVWDGGELTMNPGASISQSYNNYSNDVDVAGCAGAILLDRSTAYLRGGEISYSAAYHGGAIGVANRSTLYVGGSCVVRNNTDLTGQITDNVTVSRNSQLIVDREFTGSIGYNEGIACDTNWFGTVTWDWPSVEALTNCAARFVHDRRGVVGAAVTNGNGEAVLVWSDWLSKAGRFVDPAGDVYRICLIPGQSVVVPQPFSVVQKDASDGRIQLALEGGVEGCWYTVYSTEDLTQPFKVETSVQLKPGETFAYEIDRAKAAKFYKIVAEEGIR